MARNTVLVLQEESHLHRVIDPAGGSWFLDQLTEDLAGKAWEIFQETERQGGMLSALKSRLGLRTNRRVLPASSQRYCSSEKRASPASASFRTSRRNKSIQSPPDTEALRSGGRNTDREFSQDGPRARQRWHQPRTRSAAAVTAAVDGATIGQIASGLGFHRGSSRIDQRQSNPATSPNRSSSCETPATPGRQTHGQRPRVFLANFGPVAHHTGRATWSKNFFEAGGFEVIGNDGFEDADAAAAALAESGAEIAVICSSDKLYPDVVPPAAAKLREAGAGSIVLAGTSR